MDSTRSLFLPDNALGGWKGVGVYLYDSDAGTLTPATGYPFSGLALQLYEVSVVGTQGSWWLPTSPESTMPQAWSSDQYGGFEALESTDAAIWTTVQSQPVVRPSEIYFWIPAATLAAAPNAPQEARGKVKDSPPQTAPSPTPPDNEPSATIEKTANGLKITLTPANASARVQGNIIWVEFP